MDLVDLDAVLTGADVVITGEGSLDGQSLGGKTPLGVASRARTPRRTRPCSPSADAPPSTTPSAVEPVSTGSGR